MKILHILIIFFFTSCSQDKSKFDKQTLDFGAFSIRTPKSWKKVSSQGIDSFCGYIQTDTKDTINFDLGWFSNNLSDYIPFIIYRGNLSGDIDTSDLIIMNTKFWDPDKFRKNNIHWDTISGYEAKIVTPIKAGQGVTGVYFDSCGRSSNGKLNFNLYGEHLSEMHQKELLLAIKTITFKK